ncbi:MAG: bifunctional phosphopantothenoylcysteine decarboxylase/phosphopantothenate--cysteine ligase CoaBC [Rikenellaceae bacterium]|nr:bifunctional phosphopantothenoylcysteine decarboxylase/phosphopantothenate--cysteine ligase CoaBC [Rikenellaceae bacterium]
MLQGKKILIGITGSIAAYKAAILVRSLIREGAQVRVVMTKTAKEFITPLTLATLSKNPILVDFFDPEDGRWNSHVSIGEWADAYVIAPASANTLARMAAGIADNLLLTTYLSARCPVFVAPAMDLDMFANPSTRRSLETLAGDGVRIVQPGEGELASGLVGKGRMAEPEEIIAALTAFFQKKKDLHGSRILVTAGPTLEPIDPVRYISNHSTGKMGYALAATLADRGAEVVLVSGPAAVSPPPGVDTVRVTTAGQMYEASLAAFEGCDAAVLCAAVADYTPAHYSDRKIKKAGDELSITLHKTRDIAAALGDAKDGRIVAGFALETDDENRNALEKLRSKNLDFIVLNSLRDEGAGFGGDTNVITILDREGNTESHPLMEKSRAAEIIA